MPAQRVRVSLVSAAYYGLGYAAVAWRDHAHPMPRNDRQTRGGVTARHAAMRAVRAVLRAEARANRMAEAVRSAEAWANDER